MPNKAKTQAERCCGAAGRLQLQGAPTTCPLEGQCLSDELVYQATVTRADTRKVETYTSLTVGTLKNNTISTCPILVIQMISVQPPSASIFGISKTTTSPTKLKNPEGNVFDDIVEVIVKLKMTIYELEDIWEKVLNDTNEIKEDTAEDTNTTIADKSCFQIMKCNFCESKFKNISELERHIMEQHEEF
jgi:hypothetical protein